MQPLKVATLNSTYAEEAKTEAIACEDGVLLAMQWSDKPVMLELDCKVLIDTINEKTRDRSPLAHLITNVRELCKGNRTIIIAPLWFRHCRLRLWRREGWMLD
jgi:hypothetical protein